MKRFFESESGFSLAITLIVMLVVAILVTVLLNISIAENKICQLE